MRATLLLSSALLTSSLAVAQSITTALGSSCDASVTVGTAVTTTTLPAGPLPAGGNLDAVVLPFGAARLQWATFADAGGIGAEINLTTEVYPTFQTCSAALPDVDLVLQLSNPTTQQVVIEFSQLTSATAGTPMPLLRVDIGDDGIIELDESMQASPVTMVTQLGPTPLTVRVRGATQASGVAGVFAGAGTNFSLRCRPNDVVTTIAFGCGPVYQVEPTFTGDLRLTTLPAFADPAIAVIGFDVAPVQLPSSPWQLCLLLPSTDVLLLLLPFQPLTLPIPAAARPALLYTQTVGLGADFLRTSLAYQVNLP